MRFQPIIGLSWRIKSKVYFGRKTYTFFQTVKRILSSAKRLFSGGRTKLNNDIN